MAGLGPRRGGIACDGPQGVAAEALRDGLADDLADYLRGDDGSVRCREHRLCTATQEGIACVGAETSEHRVTSLVLVPESAEQPKDGHTGIERVQLDEMFRSRAACGSAALEQEIIIDDGSTVFGHAG